MNLWKSVVWKIEVNRVLSEFEHHFESVSFNKQKLNNHFSQRESDGWVAVLVGGGVGRAFHDALMFSLVPWIFSAWEFKPFWDKIQQIEVNKRVHDEMSNLSDDLHVRIKKCTLL